MSAERDDKLLEAVSVSLFKSPLLRTVSSGDFQTLRDMGMKAEVVVSDGMVSIPY